MSVTGKSERASHSLSQVATGSCEAQRIENGEENGVRWQVATLR